MKTEESAAAVKADDVRSEQPKSLYEQTVEMIEAVTSEDDILAEDVWTAIFMQESEIFRQQLIVKLRKKSSDLKVPMRSFDAILTSFKANEKKANKSKLLKEMKGFSASSIVPEWYADFKLDEVSFCEEMQKTDQMRCINGSLYNVNGVIPDKQIANKIQNLISPYVTSGISRKVLDLMSALKTACYSEPPPLDTKNINVLNGTLNVDGSFSKDKHFCLNRLNVKYSPNAGQPKAWLKYLVDLLDQEDILTLQEYLGYCLIPTTKSQVALFIIGNGGEGKSVIATTVKEIFSNAAVCGKLEKIESDPFTIATMESKLLFIEDDMQMGALKETQNLKQIITAKIPMLINKKNVQPYESLIYARILALGNAQMRSLFDHSDGLFRRQIILKLKPKPADREDNLSLDEEISSEIPQIFSWCFDGLQHLIKNKFHFFVSERAKLNLKSARSENCNVIDFMEDSEYIKVGDMQSSMSSVRLLGLYAEWCRQNSVEPMKDRTVLNFLKDNSEKYSIKGSNKVSGANGKCCRGFVGIRQMTELSWH